MSSGSARPPSGRRSTSSKPMAWSLVRRGNVGGAVVQLPSAERTAQMIGMVLQSRASTPADVSGALMHLEPICADMCAARDDRATEVVPYLEAEIASQIEQFDDVQDKVVIKADPAALEELFGLKRELIRVRRAISPATG